MMIRGALRNIKTPLLPTPFHLCLSLTNRIGRHALFASILPKTTGGCAAGVGAVAASHVTRLPRASIDELAHERVLHDTTRHSVGAG